MKFGERLRDIFVPKTKGAGKGYTVGEGISAGASGADGGTGEGLVELGKKRGFGCGCLALPIAVGIAVATAEALKYGSGTENMQYVCGAGIGLAAVSLPVVGKIIKNYFNK